MPRLFLAVNPPPPLGAELGALCAGVPGAKWISPDQFHLTIRFIGEVDNGQLTDIREALAGVSEPAFSLTLTGVQHFANGRKPRVLWVGTAPCPTIERLHDKVEQALVNAGLERERRKFVPHVTLARLKHASADRVGRYLEEHSLFACPPFEVSEFHLYSSFLARSGAIHTIEETYPLQ